MIHVVYGAPCAGKSTYVREHRARGEPVYDYDRLVAAFTMQKMYARTENPIDYLNALRAWFVGQATNGVAWLICSWFADGCLVSELLDGQEHDAILIEASRDECEARARGDPQRADYLDEQLANIERWFAAHGGDDMANELILSGEVCSNDDAAFLRSWGLSAFSPDDVRAAITAAKNKPLKLRLNSYGGDAMAAKEIYAALAGYAGGVEIIVESIAASAASTIAMAGACRMHSGALMMLHCASTQTEGNAEDHEKAVKMLDAVDRSIAQIYADKSGKALDEVLAWMSAETWLTAEEALAYGLIDEVIHADGSAHDTDDACSKRKKSAKNMLNNHQRIVALARTHVDEDPTPPVEDEADEPADDTPPADGLLPEQYYTDMAAALAAE